MLTLEERTIQIMKICAELKDNPKSIKKLVKLHLECVFDAGKIEAMQEMFEK